MKTLLRHTLVLALLAGFGAITLPAASNSALTPGNLVDNGGFETGAFGEWLACGAATLIDTQAAGNNSGMAHGGRYSARLGQPIDASCNNDALGPSQGIAEDVTIPSDATDVTLSFWYRATGDWAAGEINIGFTRAPNAYVGSVAFVDTIETDDLMAGWHLYRQNVKADELEALRGQTVYLAIYARFQGQPAWNWNIYIDDVRVSPVRERVEAAPLPGDLVGDGARPILVTGPGTAVGRSGLYRIDTDGGNRARIADVDLPSLRIPTWSPNGQRIVFQSDWLEPEGPVDSTHFPALIGRAYTLNADGGNLQPVFRTSGRQGEKERPLGCLGTNTCLDRGLDALDMLLTNLEWSPDSANLLATICVRNRWYNTDKFSTDASCHLSAHALATPNNPLPTVGLNAVITDAQDASWAQGDRILFTAGPSFGSRQKGVWELNLAAQPSQTARLLTWQTVSGSIPDLRSNPETLPTWAPDGRHFVTFRKSQSVHYARINDVAGGLRVNYGIMLHDRQNLAEPREVLLVDHGTLIGRPTWSPDGKYILYTVQSDDGLRADVWWLNMTSGDTGSVTRDGASLNPDWLPTHTRAPSGPPPTPDPRLGRRVYLPVSVRAGAVAPPVGVPVVFPTLTPTVAPTPLPTPANPTAVPPRGISGRVLYKGAPVSGIQIQLESCPPGLSCEMIQRVTTDANGQYAFNYVGPRLFGFHVTYRNGSAGGNSTDPRYLAVWQNFLIQGAEYAERVNGGTFDIATVDVAAPANNASLGVPATFSWSTRGLGDEKYGWTFSGDAFGLCGQTPALNATGFTFASLDCQFPSIGTNTPYQWWVTVVREGATGGAGETLPRTVTFTQ